MSWELPPPIATAITTASASAAKATSVPSASSAASHSAASASAASTDDSALAGRKLKTGIDGTEERHKRSSEGVQLRKKHRDEQVTKRRGKTDRTAAAAVRTHDQSMSLDSAAIDQEEEEKVLLRELPRLVNTIKKSTNPDEVLTALVACRRLSGIDEAPPLDDLIALGILPRVQVFIKDCSHSELQLQSVWLMTNLLSGSSKQVQQLVEAGCIQSLVQVLTSCTHANTQSQAIWALANLAGDLPKYRDATWASGALAASMLIVAKQQQLNGGSVNVELLRHVTFLVSNLCRGEPSPPFELVRPVLPFVNQMLASTDQEILMDACWTLCYVTDDKTEDNCKIAAVLTLPSVLRRLLEFLSLPLHPLKKAALRALGNIVTGDQQQTQAVLDTGLLPALRPFLVHPQATIRRDAYWTLSNICAGTSEQIQATIDAGFIVPAIDVLMDGGTFDIQRECIWILSNIASTGTAQQALYLVEHRALQAICKFFTCGDTQMLLASVEALGNLLQWLSNTPGSDMPRVLQQIEECEGLANLQALQYHEDDSVYKKASSVLKDYFVDDDDDDDDEIREDTPPLVHD